MKSPVFCTNFFKKRRIHERNDLKKKSEKRRWCFGAREGWKFQIEGSSEAVTQVEYSWDWCEWRQHKAEVVVQSQRVKARIWSCGIWGLFHSGESQGEKEVRELVVLKHSCSLWLAHTSTQRDSCLLFSLSWSLWSNVFQATWTPSKK